MVSRVTFRLGENQRRDEKPQRCRSLLGLLTLTLGNSGKGTSVICLAVSPGLHRAESFWSLGLSSTDPSRDSLPDCLV